MSNANLRTLYVAWKTALHKIFKFNNDANLLYTQYCFGVLPINFVLDVRKLCFLSKQRCHSISVHNVFYDIFGFSQAMFSVFCVWTVSWIFYCISLGRFSLSGFLIALLTVLFFIWSVCLSVSTHYCVNKDYHYYYDRKLRSADGQPVASER